MLTYADRRVCREDYLTNDGASRLCAAIMNYWYMRGHYVSCWVEQNKTDERLGRATSFVRSNLVNGLPPK